jgi:hypothetical protein
MEIGWDEQEEKEDKSIVVMAICKYKRYQRHGAAVYMIPILVSELLVLGIM